MRHILALLALVAIVVSVPLKKAPNPDDRVDGVYLVVLRPLEEEVIVDYFRYLHSQGIEFTTFEIGSFRAVSAKLNPVQLEAHLLLKDVIDYVEEDQYVSISYKQEKSACVTQQGVIWNLQRITEREAGEVDAHYTYNSLAGSGVTSYIIDTGILITHNEFGGRARWGANYADSQNTDCNGHGTHVAGTVGGKTYGVAKSVSLVAVKVLSCSGSGTNTGVISGVQWAVNDFNTKGKKSSNANMSLGGGSSSALNSAVAAAVSAGIPFAVAAGNSNADACNYSPAGEPSAITVGSTVLNPGPSDGRSSFSNWGRCLDIFAPGSSITSAWIGSNTATNTISGTSMASPHVAGVASLIQSENPTANPTSVLNTLIQTATLDAITLGCSSTGCTQSPNRLLYHACT